ncbi:hypothetical protein [Clostridium celatum]|uniref:hypothetical protein n=1 Tax=Clostridium celatum TaxID=36834 RepID=UPI001A9BCE2C|nr:hypothetical protein [Clostridium celatum]
MLEDILLLYIDLTLLSNTFCPDSISNLVCSSSASVESISSFIVEISFLFSSSLALSCSISIFNDATSEFNSIILLLSS